ncbi:type II toxin-antitoxin system RelE/ParE family toxin [Candidatus Pacearchaeota archaeon]|nr:type II toxin-antitoxin system RelE/ParE family toxin [Candidatus Pacearchaeota archaeon]
MYAVQFSQTAEKQFYLLEDSIQERIFDVLERIKIRPFHFIKRKEGTPYFILRIGDYRAILNLDLKKQIIFVVELGHRKNIYED